MKNAVIYARVSTTTQAEDGTSLGTQIAACQQFAERNGYTVVKAITDDVSGAKLQRPGLDEVRDIVTGGEADAVIVYKLDRLARETIHALMLFQEFKRKNVKLECVTAPLDSSPEGKLHMTMLSAFAEYERTQIAERTRRGRRQRIKEGKAPVSPWVSYGFRVSKSTRRFEPVPEEIRWVKQMYKWLVDEGATIGAIVYRLNANNVPTKTGTGKKRWYVTTVRNILTRPIYYGVYNWGPEVEITIPPTVDRDTWDAAQARIQRNREIALRSCKREYLLRGMLTCAHCGYKMVGHVIWGNITYQCKSRRQYQRHLPLDERCPNKSNWRNLDGIIWDEVLKAISNPQLIAEMVDKYANEHSREEEELATLQADEQATSEKLAKLLDLVLNDDIDRFTYRERKAALDKKLAATRQRIAQFDMPQVSVEELRAMCSQIQEALPLLEFKDKREFLESINLRVEVGREGFKIQGLLYLAECCSHPGKDVRP